VVTVEPTLAHTGLPAAIGVVAVVLVVAAVVLRRVRGRGPRDET
jgi:hypothetical protein